MSNQNFVVKRTNEKTGEYKTWEFETQTQALDFINMNCNQPNIQQKKSKNKPVTLSHRQVNELTTRVSRLPSPELKQQASTLDMLLLWDLLRQEAELLSECFAARYWRIEGDPASYLLLDGEMGKIRHALVWFTVDKYDCLLELFQMAWDFIKTELITINPSFNSSLSLLIEIIRESFDSQFVEALTKKLSINPTYKENLYIAKAKLFWLHAPLTQKQQQALDKDKQRTISECWLPIALEICNRAAKAYGNIVLTAKLKDYFVAEGSISDLMARYFRDIRKSGGGTIHLENQSLRM